MKAKNSIIIRADQKFKNELEAMKIGRIKRGKDQPLKPSKNSRLTLAITRHPLFKKIKLDIIEADLK